MKLVLFRDENKTFPDITKPEKITSLKIWHCKYKTLNALSNFKNLKELIIATYPDDTLKILVELKNLKNLKIIHLPKISDLSPLSKLQNLISLSLSTLPSWDASNKVTTVTTLKPISKIINLKHLELFGVVNPSKSLTELLPCKKLKTATFSKYPKKEIELFFATKNIKETHNPIIK